MRGWVAAAFALFAAISLFSVFSSAGAVDDASNAITGVPELRQLLGSSATILISAPGKAAYLQWNGVSLNQLPLPSEGELSKNSPDFLVKISSAAERALVNAGDKQSMVLCLLARKKITVFVKDFSKQALVGAGIAAKASCAKQEWPKIPRTEFHVAEAQKLGVFFSQPPGILARQPNLVYDTVTSSPNAIGPHNVFKLNPGLVGPSDVLRLNPGLIGPTDIALLNPNLHGPGQFAYLLGIGAHSNAAQYLQERGLADAGPLDNRNRWGNRR